MNQAKGLQRLKVNLEPLMHIERVKFLQKEGYTKDGAEDLIEFIFNPPRPKPVTLDSKTLKPVLHFDFTESIRRLQEQARNKAADPVSLLELKRKQFEIEVQHNRLLMHGASRFDGCSYENPDFYPTAVSNWFQNVYGIGKKPLAVITGAPGSGKTWGAITHVTSRLAKIERHYLGNVAGSNARFITAYDYAMAHVTKDYATIKDVQKCGILIFDDLGAEPGGFKGLEFVAAFDALIHSRHTFGKITIVTTNLILKSDDSDAQTFAKLYGERVADRFRESGHAWSTDEDSFRKNKAISP